MSGARRWWVLAGLTVAATVALELLFAASAHVEFFWHRIPGFDFVLGLLGGALIVLGSKALGYGLLYRPESYYQDEETRR